jgi:hypothetical protein
MPEIPLKLQNFMCEECIAGFRCIHYDLKIKVGKRKDFNASTALAGDPIVVAMFVLRVCTDA